MNAENIAYTNLGLCLHQDLVYYESPPGLQLLHCLQFGKDIQGGEHILLDSFRVAELLRQQDPEAFDALVQIPATFQKIHADRADPARMVYCRPHISVNADDEIIQVTWAPPFEGPLAIAHGTEAEQYYRGYAAFAALIESEAATAAQAVIPLSAGDVVTFNNRRMLHGRNAFHGRLPAADSNSAAGGSNASSIGSASGGLSRHLRGVYVNIDEFKNKHEVLSRAVMADKANTRGGVSTNSSTIRGNRGFHVGNQDAV